MQESGYRLNTTSKSCGYVIKPNKGVATSIDQSGKICVASDFGISQIHINTIKRYKFDLERLTTDLEYSVNSGALVLSWFYKTYAHKESTWWTRFNCGTKKGTWRNTCQTYYILVKPYL